MGVAFKALAKLGGFIMDAVRGLGKLLSNAGGAARAVMDALTEIGEKFMRFADELLGRVGRGAAGDAAETAAERTARETAEAGAERTTQKSAGTVADRGARETTQEGAEKTSREATQETGDRGAREASDDPALKAAELPAAMAEARGITELNDATGTPAPILEGILNSTVKPRYSWLERFQARPKVEPGLYSIHLIASDHVVAGKYPKPRKVGNLAGGPLENATQTRGRFQLEGGPANGVLYRADDQGNITSYIVYDNDGLAIKRVDVTGAAHAGSIPTPHVLDYGRNTLPNGTVRVHTPRGSMPRPANPDEIP
jgi:hypothetical protein